jgi:hypothetical protein
MLENVWKSQSFLSHLGKWLEEAVPSLSCRIMTGKGGFFFFILENGSTKLLLSYVVNVWKRQFLLSHGKCLEESVFSLPSWK